MQESLTIALLQAREVAMRYFRPYLKQHNLTEQQWRIMRVLATDNNAIDFYSLACQACILRPSLTGILLRMEQGKLILRMKPLSDQRKLYVSLTDKGRTLYDTVCMKVDHGYQAIETAFSAEKMSQLRTLLDELIALDTQRKPEMKDDDDETAYGIPRE